MKENIQLARYQVPTPVQVIKTSLLLLLLLGFIWFVTCCQRRGVY